MLLWRCLRRTSDITWFFASWRSALAHRREDILGLDVWTSRWWSRMSSDFVAMLCTYRRCSGHGVLPCGAAIRTDRSSHMTLCLTGHLHRSPQPNETLGLTQPKIFSWCARFAPPYRLCAPIVYFLCRTKSNILPHHTSGRTGSQSPWRWYGFFSTTRLSWRVILGDMSSP
jgi:hypothetical protein